MSVILYRTSELCSVALFLCPPWCIYRLTVSLCWAGVRECLLSACSYVLAQCSRSTQNRLSYFLYRAVDLQSMMYNYKPISLTKNKYSSNSNGLNCRWKCSLVFPFKQLTSANCSNLTRARPYCTYTCMWIVMHTITVMSSLLSNNKCTQIYWLHNKFNKKILNQCKKHNTHKQKKCAKNVNSQNIFLCQISFIFTHEIAHA